MNTAQFMINNSVITSNSGRFMYIAPGSIATTNPMHAYISNSNFTLNYAVSDALIHTKTNSLVTASNTTFTENYSIGRGSIVFADTKSTYALFTMCTF